MSSDDNPTLIFRENEEGEYILMSDAGNLFAKDDRFNAGDLKPKTFSVEEIPRGEEWRTEQAQKNWDQLRERPYASLMALADRVRARAQELRHRIDAEVEAVEEGRLSEDARAFPNELVRYVSFLLFRANTAQTLMRYIEEKGTPPAWEDLSKSAKKTIQEAIQDSPQTAYKTEDAIEAMQGYFDEVDDTPEKDVPEKKKTFFKQIASRSPRFEKWKNVQGRVDEFCKYHDIDVPNSPEGYRQILNQEPIQE